ncbi:hypothetical protein pipiens_013745 [Culex pipiens pipiens]|uniref:Ionotropic receptor n=1 Tax=Culex pipiens pipiens TaxID=38569 RepID=A0ABD1CX71_CULPP
MKPTGRIIKVVFALILVGPLSIGSNPDYTVNYTVSVIQHLTNVVESGVPKFVFIELGLQYYFQSDILDKVLAVPELANATKYVLNCDLRVASLVNLPSRVTQLLVHGNPEACFNLLFKCLRMFDASTRVMVFTLGFMKVLFESILNELNFYNVIYVDVESGEMFQGDVTAELPEPKVLYRRSPFRHLGRVLHLLHWLFPTFLTNNPVLMCVCGCERFDLHKANNGEKTILFSTIVLMFFMTSAYESKLMSLIASRPSSRRIRTLQDLAESKMKIKDHSVFALDIPLLANSLVNATESVDEWDKVHAYMTTKSIADFNLQLFYDPSQKINHYSILEEMLLMFVPGYVLAYRSPLVEVLEHTQAVFVETGFWQYWHNCDLRFLRSHYNVSFTESNEILHFQDLLLAWIIVALGLTAKRQQLIVTNDSSSSMELPLSKLFAPTGAHNDLE